ncbi:helix-turn-helix domain-containing protein [Paenibacillus sp. sgz302251]|uniref:helix-turn-helix domain-containing protein n=1 Tax=Paenibacillus sp. sgz302251 TaxID=3414493 RepID=UPI003C7B8132
MSQTVDPIKEIAERCGLSSIHYFTRTFTKVKGIPPAAFRETAHKNRSKNNPPTRHQSS